MSLPSDDSKFNTSFALILSPSVTAAELASQALVESGVPSDRISIFYFPGSSLSLGDESQADSFTTLLRTAFYDDDDAKESFFNSTPFQLLRMELNSNVVNTLHDKDEYISRETGVQNDATNANLTVESMRDAVKSLSALVLASLVQGDLQDWDISVANLISGEQDTGDDCIDIGQRCLADCRDTLCKCDSIDPLTSSHLSCRY